MGGLQITFARGAEVVQVTRDRHQWLMHLRLPEWSKAFDLDIILDTIDGRDDWSAPIKGFPVQLPPGVSWRSALPRVWTWIAGTSEVESTLKDTQRRRARSLFPSTPARAASHARTAGLASTRARLLPDEVDSC